MKQKLVLLNKINKPLVDKSKKGYDINDQYQNIIMNPTVIKKVRG